MSGIIEWPVTSQARLTCDARRCEAEWTSEAYEWSHYLSARRACGPAFEQGWRVFAGERSQFTYCPAHGPKTGMRLVHGGAS